MAFNAGPAFATPRMIGPYEIEGLIGEGGIGQVYAARDTVLDRQVAIKVLRPEMSRDRNLVDRFYVEAKSLANLNHPNITTLHTLHHEGVDVFMVMELVHGRTLAEILTRITRLTVAEALAVLAQAIAGLTYAHHRGVIHRDVKPSNLMITDEGVLKIMDFGIARVRGSQHLTRVGEFQGTLAYASPEQIKGDPVDGRTDLYSLGIFFYKMVSGDGPFAGLSDYALMTAHLHSPPPPLAGQVPALSGEAEAALMRALAKDPKERFPSVLEFGTAIGAMKIRHDSVEILQQVFAKALYKGDEEDTKIIITGPKETLRNATPPASTQPVTASREHPLQPVSPRPSLKQSAPPPGISSTPALPDRSSSDPGEWLPKRQPTPTRPLTLESVANAARSNMPESEPDGFAAPISEWRLRKLTYFALSAGLAAFLVMIAGLWMLPHFGAVTPPPRLTDQQGVSVAETPTAERDAQPVSSATPPSSTDDSPSPASDSRSTQLQPATVAPIPENPPAPPPSERQFTSEANTNVHQERPGVAPPSEGPMQIPTTPDSGATGAIAQSTEPKNAPSEPAATGRNNPRPAPESVPSTLAMATPSPPPLPMTGTLELDVRTPGAIVSVDGELLGPADRFRRELIPGRHELEISAEGYETWKQSVLINPGSQRTVSLALFKTTKPNVLPPPAPRDERTLLVITTDVNNAVISVDGIRQKGTGTVQLNVDPGEHAIVVTGKGLVRQQINVQVHPGERVQIPIQLARVRLAPSRVPQRSHAVMDQPSAVPRPHLETLVRPVEARPAAPVQMPSVPIVPRPAVSASSSIPPPAAPPSRATIQLPPP